MKMNMKLRVSNINTKAADQAGGVAIIFVVWVMVILMGIVGEFSHSMRTEINIVRNFKEEEESYQLALAGVEAAKAEILMMSNPAMMYKNESDILVFDPEIEIPAREKELGRGRFRYVLDDEDGKLDINSAAAEQLRYVFTESGVDTSDADIIVDSILDWRDANDLHMLNGAEEDYYRGLPEPYSCKDGFFDSLEELLLVKGISPEILYGSGGDKDEDTDEDDEKVYNGVVQYLTVRKSGMININTAPRLVLEAVLGIDTANRVLDDRENGPLNRPIKGGKVSSGFFSVVSTGYNSDGSLHRSVKAVLNKKENRLETVYWNDNVIR